MGGVNLQFVDSRHLPCDFPGLFSDSLNMMLVSLGIHQDIAIFAFNTHIVKGMRQTGFQLAGHSVILHLLLDLFGGLEGGPDG